MNGKPSKQLGSISVIDNSALVQFKYNTDCFKVISKIAGATYSKEDKRWKMPIVQLPKLLESRSFASDKFQYDFDESALKETFENLNRDLTAARERVQKNPFSVEEKDLDLLTFDAICRMGPDRQWILIATGKSQRSKRFLKTYTAVHYSKKARGFLIASHDFPSLLKNLRDRGISFAVEAALSRSLASETAFRSEVIQGKRLGTGAEYQKALLTPYVDIDSKNGGFLVAGLTAELRTLLIPSRVQGNKKIESFSRGELLRLLYRARQLNLKLWNTAAVQEVLDLYALEARGEYEQQFIGFRDEILSLISIPICWRLDAQGYGGLHIAQNLWKGTFSKEIGQLSSLHGGTITEGNEIFIRIIPVKLPQFFEDTQKLIQDHDLFSAISRDFRLLFEALKGRAEVLAKQQYYNELRDIELNLSEREITHKLYPHQRVAVSWLLGREYGMLGDDMGLGKTLSALVTFAECYEKGDQDFLLIVCPNSLVQNWLREARSWVPKLQLRRLPESKNERTQFLETIAENRFESLDGIVINFETMRLETVWPLLKEIVQKRKTFLCVDESQRIKNPQSQSFQAMREIAHLCSKRILLSGTPTPKDISDIWGQMLILDKGERFGKSYYNWLKTVAELGTKWSEYAVKRFIPEGIEETIARVHEILLRRKKEDVINLPEKVFLFRDLELTGDQKKRFDQIREELRVQVRTLSGELSSRSIESVLEEYLRAVQVASNPRLIDPSWKGDPVKFQELDEIVSDIVAERGEKIVIWTNYLGNIRELTERYKQYGARPFSGEVSTLERAKTIEEFQSNKKDSPKILVAIPAAGGVGITLTAAQTAVYIDRTWNAEHWLQSIDRIHRIGQQGTVRIIVLNATKVDELIGFNLKRKETQMQRLLSGAGALDQLLLPTVEELLQALS